MPARRRRGADVYSRTSICLSSLYDMVNDISSQGVRTQRTTFRDLPRELRDEVYRHAVALTADELRDSLNLKELSQGSDIQRRMIDYEVSNWLNNKSIFSAIKLEQMSPLFPEITNEPCMRTPGQDTLLIAGRENQRVAVDIMKELNLSNMIFDLRQSLPRIGLMSFVERQFLQAISSSVQLQDIVLLLSNDDRPGWRYWFISPIQSVRRLECHFLPYGRITLYRRSLLQRWKTFDEMLDEMERNVLEFCRGDCWCVRDICASFKYD